MAQQSLLTNGDAWAAAADDEDDEISKEIEYPPIGNYLPFVAMVCVQSLSFGTTISFTGPTIGSIIDDLSLCGPSADDDGDGDDGGNDDDDGSGGLCARASFFAAVYALSAMGGSLLAGPLSDHPTLGRRRVYLANALVFAAGWLVLGTSQGDAQLVAGRLLTGLGTGIAGVVVPMYVGEVSPPEHRGKLGALFNLGITVGVLGVNFLSFFGVGWRALAVAWGAAPQVCVALAFALRGRLGFPESPEFLASVAVASASAAVHLGDGGEGAERGASSAFALYEARLLEDITAALRKGALKEAFTLARVVPSPTAAASSASTPSPPPPLSCPHAKRALNAQADLEACLARLHAFSSERAKRAAKSMVGARFREKLALFRTEQEANSPHLNFEQQQQQQLSGGDLLANSGGGAGAGAGGDEGVSYADTTNNGGLCGGRYRWSTVLAVGVVSGFSGSAVNCISAFAGSIFLLAGADPGLGNLGFATAQTVVVFLGIAWFYEAYGRRPLLMASALGCAAGHLTVGAAFVVSSGALRGGLAVLGVSLFIASVSVGLGSLSWVYASEVFPSSVRGAGMSLANVFFWGISFALNNYFPAMLDGFGKQGTFIFFAAISACVFAFIALFAVETRGRSLQEIEAIVAPRQSLSALRKQKNAVQI